MSVDAIEMSLLSALSLSTLAERRYSSPPWPPEGKSREYWIDGAVRLARLLDDEKLLVKCHTRFETVLKRVEAGETPVTSKALWEAGEKWGHWPMAIMGSAMLAEFSHTGDKRYLDAIAKIYADYP